MGLLHHGDTEFTEPINYGCGREDGPGDLSHQHLQLTNIAEECHAFGQSRAPFGRDRRNESPVRVQLSKILGMP